MERESSHRAKARAKLEDKVKELKNPVEELKVEVVKKDIHLDQLQKRSDGLCTFLGETRAAVIMEFKASSEFTDLLLKNYVVGFEDFRMDIIEHFHGVDFSPIKLRVVAERSLLQTSSEDINVQDDASA